MILNRFDYRMVNETNGYGVGYQILEKSAHDAQEVAFAISLLDLRRKYFGDGVVALDCGANIGVHTIEWARKMAGWGSVVAIEAQERIYYALAGNIAINNCFNAKAMFAAVTAEDGTIKIPQPNYLAPASFGSLELRKRENNEFIGQKIDYSDDTMSEVRAIRLDSLGLKRIDMIKLDIEGMELDALQGATNSIETCHPILIVESIKTDEGKLLSLLAQHEYQVFRMGMNFLAVHKSDSTLNHVANR